MRRATAAVACIMRSLSLVAAVSAVVPVTVSAIVLLVVAAAPAYAQIQPSQDTNSKEPAGGIYRVGRGVSAPRPKYQPDPEFSEQARKLGYEGVCVLELVVDTEGMPRNIRVTRPVGMGLDEKAMEAVRQWRFTPAMKDGTPVAVQIAVEVSFHLYAQKAVGLFQKANSGDAKAQFELAQLLLSDPALANDDSRGLAFMEKAAKQGLPKAEFAMGEYWSSRKNDLVKAYIWYAQAERHHYKDSGARMKEVGEKMTPEQLAEARQRLDSGNPF
ncbi:MAG: TonB family protein [Terriglobales bacterium]